MNMKIIFMISYRLLENKGSKFPFYIINVEHTCQESLPALMETLNRHMKHIRVSGKGNSFKREFWILN